MNDATTLDDARRRARGGRENGGDDDGDDDERDGDERARGGEGARDEDEAGDGEAAADESRGDDDDGDDDGDGDGARSTRVGLSLARAARRGGSRDEGDGDGDGDVRPRGRRRGAREPRDGASRPRRRRRVRRRRRAGRSVRFRRCARGRGDAVTERLRVLLHRVFVLVFRPRGAKAKRQGERVSRGESITRGGAEEDGRGARAEDEGTHGHAELHRWVDGSRDLGGAVRVRVQGEREFRRQGVAGERDGATDFDHRANDRGGVVVFSHVRVRGERRGIDRVGGTKNLGLRQREGSRRRRRGGARRDGVVRRRDEDRVSESRRGGETDEKGGKIVFIITFNY